MRLNKNLLKFSFGVFTFIFCGCGNQNIKTLKQPFHNIRKLRPNPCISLLEQTLQETLQQISEEKKIKEKEKEIKKIKEEIVKAKDIDRRESLQEQEFQAIEEYGDEFEERIQQEIGKGKIICSDEISDLKQEKGFVINQTDNEKISLNGLENTDFYKNLLESIIKIEHIHIHLKDLILKAAEQIHRQKKDISLLRAIRICAYGFHKYADDMYEFLNSEKTKDKLKMISIKGNNKDKSIIKILSEKIDGIGQTHTGDRGQKFFKQTYLEIFEEEIYKRTGVQFNVKEIIETLKKDKQTSKKFNKLQSEEFCIYGFYFPIDLCLYLSSYFLDKTKTDGSPASIRALMNGETFNFLYKKRFKEVLDKNILPPVKKRLNDVIQKIKETELGKLLIEKGIDIEKNLIETKVKDKKYGIYFDDLDLIANYGNENLHLEIDKNKKGKLVINKFDHSKRCSKCCYKFLIAVGIKPNKDIEKQIKKQEKLSKK